jgi:hypothetical protein
VCLREEAGPTGHPTAPASVRTGAGLKG